MELFDLYDEQRRLTGRTMVRGEAVPEGLYRLVVHIGVFNAREQLLIQQRQSFKKGWPNMWDISVGGCVRSGETSQQGAQRELFEELGLNTEFSVPAFTSTFDGGYDDIYIVHMDPELSTLRLQEEEVQAARWACKDEILAMIDGGTFIPYGRAFIEYLFYRSGHNGNI